MKTTKFFSVLSLALIFVGVTSGFSKNFENLKAKNLQGTGIRYQVAIHPELSTAPCNTYLVQIVDETGSLVAPAQVFVLGVNKYVFYEKVSAMGSMYPRRVAKLIPIKYPEHYVCAYPLFTLPDVKIGPFLSGQTYNFDLYPRTQAQGQ